MNAFTAYEWLITSALGHLVDAGEKGCCNQCCGTCAALIWLRDVNDAVRATMTDPDDLSDWQRADGSIDWTRFDGPWGVTCDFADDHDVEGVA